MLGVSDDALVLKGVLNDFAVLSLARATLLSWFGGLGLHSKDATFASDCDLSSLLGEHREGRTDVFCRVDHLIYLRRLFQFVNNL